MRWLVVVLLLALSLPGIARGEWLDRALPLRRGIELPGDLRGETVVVVEVATAGRHLPDGADLRVADDAGRVAPLRVLRVGPGDVVSVAFLARAGVNRYYAYFGGEAKVPTRSPEPLALRGGLLWESRALSDGEPNNPQQFEELWKRAEKRPLGAAFIDRLYVGVHPVVDNARVISRITGTIDVPADGTYRFAASADDRAVLFIDDKPVVVARGLVGDTRYNGEIALKRGRRDIKLYHLDYGGDCRLSVFWKRPGAGKYEPIAPELFGPAPLKARTLPLEELRAELVADLEIEYLDECFVANALTHRVRLIGRATAPPRASVQYEWDFGDGQAARGSQVEHVFLEPGEYAVKVTARSAALKDERTTRLSVGRVYGADARVREAPVDGHAAVVVDYDFSRLNGSQLPIAVRLLARARKTDALLQATTRLLSLGNHAIPDRSAEALREAVPLLVSEKRMEELKRAFEYVPERSNLSSVIGSLVAEVLVWRDGDYPTAVRLLRRLSGADGRELKFALAEALLLNQQVEEARKVIDGIAERDPPAKRVAISGAMARNVEFFIEQDDRESGEVEWYRWMRRFPHDLLDGYSVLLRVRLVERDYPQAAARAAEAFASAVPESAYAPQLLERAARLLKKTDPARAAELERKLKERYPESPEANR